MITEFFKSTFRTSITNLSDNKNSNHNSLEEKFIVNEYIIISNFYRAFNL